MNLSKRRSVKTTPKPANLHIRLPDTELTTFKNEARKSGLDFTMWVRLSLRKIAGFDKR